MADYVAKLRTFTVNYETESEVVDMEGQKLQYSASGSVAIERPSLSAPRGYPHYQEGPGAV